MKVIRQAAQVRFLRCEQVVDESAVRTRTRHDREVSNPIAKCQLADRDCLSDPADFLERGAHRVERDPQMPGQCICAAQGDDAEGAGRRAIFADKPLQNLMDGAVAAAGEDDVRAAGSSFPSLVGRRAGSDGWNNAGNVAKIGKCLADLAEYSVPTMPVAARGGVIDEDTTHATILRRSVWKPAQRGEPSAAYPAFSVSSAQRA